MLIENMEVNNKMTHILNLTAQHPFLLSELHLAQGHSVFHLALAWGTYISVIFKVIYISGNAWNLLCILVVIKQVAILIIVNIS